MGEGQSPVTVKYASEETRTKVMAMGTETERETSGTMVGAPSLQSYVCCEVSSRASGRNGGWLLHGS